MVCIIFVQTFDKGRQGWSGGAREITLQSKSAEARYRIHNVAEMTGIAATTLRAWERRYGVPAPSRARSHYRLYSDQDVAVIQRMQELCAAGMAPKEAAAKVLSEGAAAERPAREDPFQVASGRIVQAAEVMDRQAIQREIRHALGMGPAAEVFERVIAPAEQEIGERWHQGTLSVAAEHLASEIIEAHARQLLEMVQSRFATRLVLLACLAEEQHVLPLIGAGLRFAERGFEVVVLGATTPPEAITAAARALGPDLVGLSMTVRPAPERAGPLIAAYVRAAAPTPVIFGGAGAVGLEGVIERAGGLVYLEGAADWPRIERALVGRAPLGPAGPKKRRRR
jgi:DNA-binding transcriptional MerR regulator